MKKVCFNFLLCLFHALSVLLLNGCLCSFVVWYYDYECIEYVGLLFVTACFLILEFFVMCQLKKSKLLYSPVARVLLGLDYCICGISSALWIGFSIFKVFTDYMMPDMRIIGTILALGAFMFLRTVLTKHLDKQK